VSHIDDHPSVVNGCWKCRMGVGRSSSVVAFERIRQGKDPIRKKPVRIEEGSHRGKVGGHHTEHMDGRQDAHVNAPQVRIGSTEVR
jgi:surface antigen